MHNPIYWTTNKATGTHKQCSYAGFFDQRTNVYMVVESLLKDGIVFHARGCTRKGTYRSFLKNGVRIQKIWFLNHEAQLFVYSGHQTPTPVRYLDYSVGRVYYPILSSTRLASRLGRSPCDHWTPRSLKPETNRTPDRTNLQQIKVILFGYGLSFSMSIRISYKAMVP
ncbi:hypothetical protein V6N12_056924 [Hibiscus sabdariffa]|uniref:Uncharacterized protein n=1 Tax=Hibiscus sabdariffa TaxID=183260 RepID=A0ABR2DCT7_9ROSI